jgi:hypothetical protein
MLAKVLWLDLAQHLRPSLEPEIAEAIRTLATFQRWLHGVESSQAIRDMIEEREGTHGDRDRAAQWASDDEGADTTQEKPEGPV